MSLLKAAIDINIDFDAIITALAPSILIIVTYFFSKKNRDERHEENKEKLTQIQNVVNGRLTAEKEENKSLKETVESNRKRIAELETLLESRKPNVR